MVPEMAFEIPAVSDQQIPPDKFEKEYRNHHTKHEKHILDDYSPGHPLRIQAVGNHPEHFRNQHGKKGGAEKDQYPGYITTSMIFYKPHQYLFGFHLQPHLYV
jgi:hypothetical protein